MNIKLDEKELNSNKRRFIEAFSKLNHYFKCDFCIPDTFIVSSRYYNKSNKNCDLYLINGQGNLIATIELFNKDICYNVTNIWELNSHYLLNYELEHLIDKILIHLYGCLLFINSSPNSSPNSTFRTTEKRKISEIFEFHLDYIPSEISKLY